MAGGDHFGTTSGSLPGLTFTQAEVYFILGNALRSLYQDLLDQPVPAHLQALLDQLEKSSAQHPATDPVQAREG